MARWHSCNVLQAGEGTRQLWQFDARNGGFALSRQQVAPGEGPLPAGMVAKSWRSIWQPKLNVAWLPADSVFLRVVQLPQADFQETLSMVELQLEKLSPIPVTQVVWSVHPLSQATGALQTIIVVFAERKAVEEFLGQLEGHGYLADRLELRVLDQLQATEINEDGAWIYPAASGGHNTALVAWWYEGELRNLTFVNLPMSGDRAKGLGEQLRQMTWAGELEGWLTKPPTWHLVADEAAAAEWEPFLREGLGQPLKMVSPLPPAELAARTAKRAAQNETKVNLLPAEFATRYRQQFFDRLWGRGLLALLAVYGAVVVVYFIALSIQSFRVSRVEGEVKTTSLEYTNTMQIKARYDVLKDRQELKFAALNCWRAVAELLPETVTLESFTLVDGKRLTLNGTAPSDQRRDLYKFAEDMRKVTVDGEPLFDQRKDPSFNDRAIQGGNNVNWTLILELARSDLDTK